MSDTDTPNPGKSTDGIADKAAAAAGQAKDKAAEFAGQAKEAAGPLKDKAAEFAGQAKEAAGPLKDKAADLAGQAAVAAGPLVEKAASLMGQALGAAADNIGAVAERIDSATKGKYSSQIKSASDKVEDGLRKASEASGPSHTPGGSSTEPSVDPDQTPE